MFTFGCWQRSGHSSQDLESMATPSGGNESTRIQRYPDKSSHKVGGHWGIYPWREYTVYPSNSSIAQLTPNTTSHPNIWSIARLNFKSLSKVTVCIQGKSSGLKPASNIVQQFEYICARKNPPNHTHGFIRFISYSCALRQQLPQLRAAGFFPKQCKSRMAWKICRKLSRNSGIGFPFKPNHWTKQAISLWLYKLYN
jgi:hypothetical protein